MTIIETSRLETLLQDSSTNLRQAWERFVEQQPTNAELRLVVEWFTDFRAAACQLLLRCQPQAADLLAICYFGDSHREAAWTSLLAQGASNKALRQVIAACPELRQSAWRQLLAQNPSEKEIRDVLWRCQELKLEAIRWLLPRITDGNELVRIIKRYEVLRPAAWSRLLEFVPSLDQLMQVYDAASELRLEVASQLDQRNLSAQELASRLLYEDATTDMLSERAMLLDPSSDVLVEVVKHSNKFREQAWHSLVQSGPENALLIQLYNSFSEVDWKRRIVDILLRQQPTVDELSGLFTHGAAQFDDVWELFLSRSPSPEMLVSVITAKNSYQAVAWQRLRECNPQIQDLLRVIPYLENPAEAIQLAQAVPHRDERDTQTLKDYAQRFAIAVEATQELAKEEPSADPTSAQPQTVLDPGQMTFEQLAADLAAWKRGFEIVAELERRTANLSDRQCFGILRILLQQQERCKTQSSASADESAVEEQATELADAIVRWGDRLLGECVDKQILAFLMFLDNFRLAAGRRFLELNPSADEIMRVVALAPGVLEVDMHDLVQQLDKGQLVWLLENSRQLDAEIAERLIELAVTNDELRPLLRTAKRAAAAIKMLINELSDEDRLALLACEISALHKSLWLSIEKDPPGNGDALLAIASESESLRDPISELLTRHPGYTMWRIFSGIETQEPSGESPSETVDDETADDDFWIDPPCIVEPAEIEELLGGPDIASRMQIENLYGNVPLQGEGTLDGMHWDFYARFNTWTFDLTDVSSPEHLDVPLLEGNSRIGFNRRLSSRSDAGDTYVTFKLAGTYGNRPYEAGHMPQPHARILLAICTSLYVAALSVQRFQIPQLRFTIDNTRVELYGSQTENPDRAYLREVLGLVSSLHGNR